MVQHLNRFRLSLRETCCDSFAGMRKPADASAAGGTRNFDWDGIELKYRVKVRSRKRCGAEC